MPETIPRGLVLASRILIGAAAITLIWFLGFVVKVHTESRLWPMGHHPTLLLFLIIILAWTAVIIGVGFGVVVMVRAADLPSLPSLSKRFKRDE